MSRYLKKTDNVREKEQDKQKDNRLKGICKKTREKDANLNFRSSEVFEMPLYS